MEALMKDLIIKRPQQMGKCYEKELTVIIDGTQQIEVGNGESKSIQLEEGKHSIRFQFYYKGSKEDLAVPLPSFLNGLASMLEMNLQHDEIIELQETTECEVKISNQLKITISTKHKAKKVSSKSSTMISSKVLNWFKTFLYAIAPITVSILLSLTLIEAAFDELWRLSVELMISYVLYAIILFTVPTIINAGRTRNLDQASADEAGKRFDKYILHATIIMIALMAITALIAFVFDAAFTIYIICALLSISIAEFIIIGQDFNVSAIIVFGIALLVALLLTIIVYVLAKESDRVGETCGTCGGDGRFQGRECPSCHGFGIYVD